MARPALLRNSIAVLLGCLVVFGCSKNTPQKNAIHSRVLLNKMEQQVTFENGLLMIITKHSTAHCLHFTQLVPIPQT